MNINGTFANNILTIALEGNIDSVTAPEAEERVMALRREYPEGEVVLDAEKLNYISSSGLRVILKLRKMEGALKMVNVSSEVYEVLDITGFVDLLEVSRAMRTVSVEGCEVLGQGSRGKVVRLDEDTIVKLFLHDGGLEEAKEEQSYARKAFVMGVPTAIPYDIVKCEGHYGLVFELVDSRTVAGYVCKHPEKLDQTADRFAELLKTLHTTHVPAGTLKSTRELFGQYIDALKPYLEEEEIRQLHRINDAIPEKDTVIHGDFHPNNVMVQGGEDLILIDMADISCGNPLYDIASFFVGQYMTSKELREKMRGMPAEMLDRFFPRYLDKYMEDKTPEQREQFLAKAKVLMLLTFCVFLRYSWAASPMLVEKVQQIVRGQLLADVEQIVALMAQE